MKVSFLLLFLGILHLSASSYAQNKRLNIQVDNTTIKEILKSIESQTEFTFFYISTEVDVHQKVTGTYKNARVTDILDQILKEKNIGYRIQDKQILLYNLKTDETASSKARQGIRVTGTVSDNNGVLVPGVNVIIRGTTLGTTTDVNGEFTITVPSDTCVLQFRFIGYQLQEIVVGNRRIIAVTLNEATTEIGEVTVVAFAKQKKESVVASITTINPSELKVPSSNLTTSFAGRIPGMISYQRSGEPGKDNAEFFIRGVTTFGYKKDPLILVDNNETSASDLARILPDDIQSFTIMKDATATSLYGSRGANGVILVTTKSGQEGNAKVNLRFEESLSSATYMPELADPITYMRQHNEAVKTRNPLGASPYSPNKIDNTIADINPYVYPANDWYHLLFRDYTSNQRLNLNISGGGKVSKYYLSAGVNNDNGNLRVDKRNNYNNNINVKSYLLRSNVNINLTKTTEVVVRLHGMFETYNGPVDSGQDLYRKVMRTNPVLFPAYFEPDQNNIYTQHVLFGNYMSDGNLYLNPYADMIKGYRTYTSARMLAQFEVSQKLDMITEGLAFRALVNTNRYSYYDILRQSNPYYYKVGSYNKTDDTYVLDLLNEKGGTEYLSYEEFPKQVTSADYLEMALEWNRIFTEKHAVSGLLVFTRRQQLNANAPELQLSLPYRNLNFAGRATYAYDSRYFTEFNFGYNGSERFSEKERFGFFPSVGLGWLISNEAFWNDRLKEVVNKLKLKGTYGLVGNDAIGDQNDRFFYLSKVNMDNSNYGSSFGTYGNAGGYSLNGISVDRYANDLITWETAEKLNIGIELGLFNKLEIQADYFAENRSNILMTRSSIPTTMGTSAEVRANVGKAKSHGFDASVNYNHSFTKDLWITGMANFTYATSQFVVYEEPDYSATPWRSKVGYSLNQTWGYIAERLFVDDEEIWNSPAQSFPNPNNYEDKYKGGDVKYKDINKDGKITEQDMVPIGFPTSPEIIYGFGLSIGYKHFDLSFFFQGLARESFWMDANATAPFLSGQNALLQVYADNHWSEENRNLYALWPRLSPNVINNNIQTSTWFMRDGSFLRLKSLEFGYTLPHKLFPKANNFSLRIYYSGINLLTFSKFKLWDPEMGGNGLGYPIQKVSNFGIQLSF